MEQKIDVTAKCTYLEMIRLIKDLFPDASGNLRDIEWYVAEVLAVMIEIHEKRSERLRKRMGVGEEDW